MKTIEHINPDPDPSVERIKSFKLEIKMVQTVNDANRN